MYQLVQESELQRKLSIYRGRISYHQENEVCIPSIPTRTYKPDLIPVSCFMNLKGIFYEIKSFKQSQKPHLEQYSTPIQQYNINYK